MADKKPATHGKRIREAREKAGLSQEAAARELGVSTQTVYRWESGDPIKPRDLAAMERLYNAELGAAKILIDSLDKKAGRVAEPSPGRLRIEGHAPDRIIAKAPLPFRNAMSRPAIRARLAEIRSELIAAGADEKTEEDVMRLISDRDRIATYAGGSTDDNYTEAQLLQAINNVAEAAMRFIKGPRL